MAQDTATDALRRSRLSVQRRHQILTTVTEELTTLGYEVMTLDSVAARAHCSKATLYRLWATEAQLVIAALDACLSDLLTQEDRDRCDTGSLASDVHAFAATLCQAGQEVRRSSDRPEPSLLERSALGGGRMQNRRCPCVVRLDAIVRRARERGEVARHSGSGAVLDHLVPGFPSHRSLLVGSARTTPPHPFADQVLCQRCLPSGPLTAVCQITFDQRDFMTGNVLIRGFIAVLRCGAGVYWYAWRRHTYVPYHDDIVPLDLPANDTPAPRGDGDRWVGTWELTPSLRSRHR